MLLLQSKMFTKSIRDGPFGFTRGATVQQKKQKENRENNPGIQSTQK